MTGSVIPSDGDRSSVSHTPGGWNLASTVPTWKYQLPELPGFPLTMPLEILLYGNLSKTYCVFLPDFLHTDCVEHNLTLRHKMKDGPGGLGQT